MPEKFLTKKRTDKKLIELFTKFDEDNVTSRNYRTVNGMDFTDLSSVEEILDDDVSILKLIKIKTSRQVSITITRTDSKFSDDVTVSLEGSTPQNNDESFKQSFLETYIKSKKVFGELSIESHLTTLLGQDAAEHYRARDVALGQQEEILTGFTKQLTDFSVDLKARNEEAEVKREEVFQKRLLEQDEDFQNRNNELKKRESLLDQKREEVNDRESKFERRQTIQDLIKSLDSSSKEFEFRLTPATRQLRNPVHLVALAIVLFFGYLFVRFIIEKTPTSPDSNLLIWHYVRLLTAFLGILITSGTYARWMGTWASKHAGEEFRLKRMLLDVRRANLLIEMALKWRQENEDEAVPQEILDALSRHLFEDERGKDHEVPPVETLATAMLGSAASLNLKLGDNELGFDRKGIKKLKKPVKPED